VTTYLDANALVKLFTEEPGVDEVEALIDRGDCAVTAVNFSETAYVVWREARIPIRALRGLAESRLAGLVRVVPIDEEHAWRAAELRSRHYHGRRSALSFADCLLLAAAGAGDAIASADAAVTAAARAEGLDVVELPPSRPGGGRGHR
jgi:predicted nucleic acid-binding protein